MTMLHRFLFACAFPLLLTGCLLVPGKFASDLTIHADRSFAFSYKGQVIAADPSEGMNQDEPLKPDATAEEKAAAAEKAKEKAAKAKEREEKNRAIAAALSKEYGYRSVIYRGNGLFDVDYAVKGMLTTNYVFPFNSDAEVMIPFVAIETRKDGTVRVRAPGFGKAPGQGSPAGAMPMMNDPSDKAEGVFTITTDAEIVAQNQEDGAKTVGANKVISWTVGKIKKDAPTAVLRMKN
jgi:hypothetical protein